MYFHEKISRSLGGLYFALRGFTFAKEKCNVPIEDLPEKAIWVCLPHTCTEDIPLTASFVSKYLTNAKTLVKSKYFKGPPALILNLMNCLPITPGAGLKVSSQIKNWMDKGELSHAFMSPDGTKTKRDFINSGWYHIAKDLKLPVILGYLCFETKTFGYHVVDPAPEDENEMIAILKDFYKDKKGKFPEQESVYRFRKAKVENPE